MSPAADRSRFGRELAGVLAALLAVPALLAGCGGEDGGREERFSIGGRGLDDAVDSVRRQRRSPPAGDASGAASGSPDARAALPAGVPAALDSGNSAYRAGNYRAALEQFERITEEHPELGSAWFGVYMAQRALGNEAAADSAMRRAGMGSSEAARAHGSPGDSASPHDFVPGAGGDTAGG